MNLLTNKKTNFKNLGRIDYKEAWDYQESLLKETVDIKIANRKLGPENQKTTPNHLIFCEHPHVYTLGKSGDELNLLINEEKRKKEGIQYFKTNRGGDITYHGPGQIVGYPILDLDNFFTDIHKYLRFLEEAVINTLDEFGIKSGRIPGLTGVWVNPNSLGNSRKICALGVKTSRWVTMHGLALNVNTDLDFFNFIIPCGINDKAVTSMERELGKKLDLSLVQKKLRDNLALQFQMQLIEE